MQPMHGMSGSGLGSPSSVASTCSGILSLAYFHWHLETTGSKAAVRLRLRICQSAIALPEWLDFALQLTSATLLPSGQRLAERLILLTRPPYGP